MLDVAVAAGVYFPQSSFIRSGTSTSFRVDRFGLDFVGESDCDG